MAAAALLASPRSSLASSAAKKRKPWLPSTFREVLHGDKQFILHRLSPAAESWLPKLSKQMEDFLWLRKLEDPSFVLPSNPPPWPKPSYPSGLSAVELFTADIGTLKDYADYIRIVTKSWSVPLPEPNAYDPRQIAHYFSIRPHLIAIRLVQVFVAFASAFAKMQLSSLHELCSSSSSSKGQRVDSRRKTRSYYGRLLKEVMLSLGPTFVKLGQSISTRPDMIGTEISEELSELHDQIPPFPRSLAMRIIEEELGCSLHEAFSFVSLEHAAAASFGQVYEACTIDGCQVAVKVQRPNLHHVVIRDIYILRLGLVILRKVARRKSDIALYADEIGSHLLGELDYTLEAKNAAEFLEAHGRFPFIHVPKVIWKLSRKKVLTMEWMAGEKPTDLLSLSRGLIDQSCHEKQLLAKHHLLDLVNKGVEASLVQLLETGLLHADPHPGNLLYTPEGKIGFLDFGLVCRMEKKHQFALLASILHIVNGDWPALVQDLSEMEVISPEADLRLITRDFMDSLEGLSFKNGIPDVKFSKVLGKIWTIALKYHFRMPPYYPLVLRSLASLEGLAVAADRNFQTFKAAYPYVVYKLLTDNSVHTTRLLYSVLLNKRKELQLEKVTLFLEAGATSLRLKSEKLSSNLSETNISPEDPGDSRRTFSVADLVWSLLPSRKGAVLRRLLMTLEPSSLAQIFVSSKAVHSRRYIVGILRDAFYSWQIEVLGIDVGVQLMAQKASPAQSASLMCTMILKDRRLKIIANRMLQSVKANPVLLVRVAWASCAIVFTAWFESFLRVAAFVFQVCISSFTLSNRTFCLQFLRKLFKFQDSDTKISLTG